MPNEEDLRGRLNLVEIHCPGGSSTLKQVQKILVGRFAAVASSWHDV